MTIVTKLFLSNLCLFFFVVLLGVNKLKVNRPTWIRCWDVITTISIPAWIVWLIITY